MGRYAEKLGLSKLPLDAAREAAEALLEKMVVDGVIARGEVCGSIRRNVPEVADADLQVISMPERDPIAWLINQRPVSQVFRGKPGSQIASVLYGKVLVVDLYLTTEEAWAAHLMFLTGSHLLNIQQRAVAKAKGFRLSQHGLFRPDESLVEAKTEQEVYEALGFQWLEPEARSV